MDSLGRLSDTLPGTEAAEKDLQASFRSAALALTSLFKQGKKATTKAYITGKREALQDVLEFVQASLDHPATPNAIDGNGQLNVARLMDYICARQETLKAEEEGEDDDEAPAPPLQRRQAHAHAPPSSASFGDRRAPPHASASAPVTRPASAAPRDQNAPVPQPVASTSSSVPSSPAFTRHASHSARSQYASGSMSNASASIVTATTGSSAITSQSPSCPSSPAPGSGAQTPIAPNQSGGTPLTAMSQPTPLTRAQARREKSANGTTQARRHKSSASTATSNSKDRSTRSGALLSNPVSTAVGVTVDGDFTGGVGEDVLHTTTGMKRRWTNVSTTDLALDDYGPDITGLNATDSATDASESQPDDALTGGEDHMEMEMDGWNGSGERPPKRVARGGLR
ncbi:hypothetical protein OIV83_000737 [Microbotryomycetes sp. JL201]|nr:hypothetical protein OIV83_000737 [Microbotryomycetes sp. JL201]